MLRKQRAEHQSLLGTTAQERGKLSVRGSGSQDGEHRGRAVQEGCEAQLSGTPRGKERGQRAQSEGSEPATEPHPLAELAAPSRARGRAGARGSRGPAGAARPSPPTACARASGDHAPWRAPMGVGAHLHICILAGT